MLGYGAARRQGRRRCGVRISARRSSGVQFSLWGCCGSRGHAGATESVRGHWLWPTGIGYPVRSCGTLQQELFGARSAAPAALPPRESPRSRTRARRAWIQRGSGARTQGHGRCGGGPDPEGGRGPLRDAKQLYGTEACSRRVNRVVIRNKAVFPLFTSRHRAGRRETERLESAAVEGTVHMHLTSQIPYIYTVPRREHIRY